MDKTLLPVLEKEKYIETFLKLIKCSLEKDLPKKANEWDMTEKAFEIFHKGLSHLKKDERMAYDDREPTSSNCKFKDSKSCPFFIPVR